MQKKRSKKRTNNWNLIYEMCRDQTTSTLSRGIILMKATILNNEASPNIPVGTELTVKEEIGDYYITDLGPVAKTDCKTEMSFWEKHMKNVEHLNETKSKL